MKRYTEQEVVEILKKFGMEFTKNINRDTWYKLWIEKNEKTENLNIETIFKNR